MSITGSVDGDLVRLVIRDNGNGFSEASLMRLNSDFRKMEEDPSAFSAESSEHLGLVNTYLRLLHASKGQIRMSLHNDNGAVITLTLPL